MLYFDNNSDSDGQIELQEDGMLQSFESVDQIVEVPDKKDEVLETQDPQETSGDDINSSIYSQPQELYEELDEEQMKEHMQWEENQS